MCRVAVAGALWLALTGCGRATTDVDPEGQPTEPPTAIGTVRTLEPGADATLVGFTPDAGYEYFEGTTFRVAQQVPGVDATQLEVGDRIEVWTGMCAESFPVQCAVERLELASP